MPGCSTVVNLPRDEEEAFQVKRKWLKQFYKLYANSQAEMPPFLTSREQKVEATWQRNISREINCTGQMKGTRESILEPELLLTGVEADKGFGDRVEVRLESSILVSDESVTLPQSLKLQTGFKLPYDYSIHISTQKSVVSSISGGLICSIAVTQDGEVKNHSFCRIGGVITIVDENGQKRTLGLTAAHGLLDYFMTTASDRPGSQAHSKRETSTFRSFKETLGKKLHSLGRSTAHGEKSDPELPANPSALGRISMSRANEVEWAPIRRIYSTNWLGGGWDTTNVFMPPFIVREPDRLTPAADFALLELDVDVADINRINGKRIEDWVPDSELSSGPVTVLLGEGITTGAQLLYSVPHLYLRGIEFPTRKLQLDNPLAPGTSGCWVIQGDKLCGMIVMSYPTEPFAHMVTVEKLFTDIKKTLGNVSKIVLPAEIAQAPEIDDTPKGLKLDRRVDSEVGDDFSAPPIRSLSLEPNVKIPELQLEGIPMRETANAFDPPDPSPANIESNPVILPGDDLEVKLRKRMNMREDGKAFSGFVHREVLKEILTKDEIIKEMERYKSKGLLPGEVDTEELSLKVIGGEQKKEDDECYVTFALLLLLARGHEIGKFIQSRIKDSDLPLDEEDSVRYRLGRTVRDSNDEKFELLECFDTWSISEREHFQVNHWRLISPN